MKLDLLLALVLGLIGLALTGCGNFNAPQEFVSTAPAPAVPCTVEKIPGGSKIRCPDGTESIVLDGSSGADGHDGHDGSDGLSMAFSQGSASSSLCAAGGSVIAMGLDLNRDTVLQLEERQSVAVICNGANGHDGADAPASPFMPIALVNPCGDAPSRHDEVFMRLANGTMLASFSDNASGQNTRFSVLTAGTYQTTDGDNCVFTLNAQGEITYENKHY